MVLLTFCWIRSYTAVIVSTVRKMVPGISLREVRVSHIHESKMLLKDLRNKMSGTNMRPVIRRWLGRVSIALVLLVFLVFQPAENSTDL